MTQLSPGHIYGFQVRARTAAGHGPFGVKVYFQTLPEGKGVWVDRGTPGLSEDMSWAHLGCGVLHLLDQGLWE